MTPTFTGNDGLDRKMTGPILKISDMLVQFGGLVAVNRVSFQVEVGEIVSVIGPNGAGKTTLFNTINGQIRPTGGRVFFEDREITGKPVHQVARLGIGRTFQGALTFGSMTVYENLLVGTHLQTGGSGFVTAALSLPSSRRAERRARGKVESVIRILGLERWADVPIRDVPIALQKIAEVGRALAGEPKMLLLDEPAAGLSKQEKEGFLDLIREIRQTLVRSILLIEHDIDFVLGISDRIIVLDFGEKIAEGVPEQIRNDPDVRRAYVGDEYAT